MSITIFFSPSNFYFLAFPGSYTSPKSYGHHFPVRRNTFKRQGLVWRLPNRHLHRESFHIKCDFSACAVNLLIFLFGCAAYGLLFKQTRALRSNSVFKAIAMLAKPAKICQRSAGTSGQTCTWCEKPSLCKWLFGIPSNPALPLESVPADEKAVHIQPNK